MTDKVKPFTFHGMLLKEAGENHIGDCPFCDKENHFFVLSKTGQYNCRRCQNEGNYYSFLEELYKTSLVKSTNKNAKLQALAVERGINIETFVRWGLAVSILDDSFLLPMYNLKGKIANLARIVKIKGKWVVYGTPLCKLWPFGTTLLQKKQKVRWATEGPWDGMILDETLRKTRLDGKQWVASDLKNAAIQTQGVIALPGAGTFQAEYLQFWDNCEMPLVFDNDHPFLPENGKKKLAPGWDGQERLLRIAADNNHSVSKFQKINWGKDKDDGHPGTFNRLLKDGYDLRDLIKDRGPVKAMNFIALSLRSHKLSSPESNGRVEPAIEPLPCGSFLELCEWFDKYLHFTIDFRQTVAVALATIISTNLPSEQLWFRIIGPPGSGKSTLAECVSSARDQCLPMSLVTGFHSGFTGGPGGEHKEASLLPLLNGKCGVWKDADTLMSHPSKDRILSEMRDFYDGSTRAVYRNRKHFEIENMRNSFLFHGTDTLRGLNRSFRGDRFLDCDIVGGSDTSEYMHSAVSTAFSDILGALSGSNEATGESGLALKRVTKGFILDLSQRIQEKRIKIPSCTSQHEDRLKAMASLLAYVRARVEREREEITYRPRVELATRLGKQFVKLAICLAVVLDKSEIDKEVMGIVRKVLHDTACGFNFELVDYLFKNPLGKSSVAIAINLEMSDSTVRRLVGDMNELGIISRREDNNRSGVGGRNVHMWQLCPEVRELYKLAALDK